MTTHANQLPLPPFHVMSSAFPPAETNVTPGDAGIGAGSTPSGKGPFSFFGLGLTPSQLVALPLFALVYLLVQQLPMFCPIAVLVLLVATLARLDAERRRIAIVPVSVAALLLASRMVTVIPPDALTKGLVPKPDVGMSWLPLFFAACLFCMPDVTTNTGRILQSLAFLLLVSGLLPGEGFATVFFLVQCFLFLALMVGLGLDFLQKPKGAAAAQPIQG